MLYEVISTQNPPVTIDNTQLLGDRVIQKSIANCMVISVCNIIEAKHWQQTGIKLKFDYDEIYNILNTENNGIFFTDIQRILDLISTMGIKYKRSLYCSKSQCRTQDIFVNYLHASIHKFQFATIGVTQLNGVSEDNHALTVCGYNANTVIVQTTYSTTSRFVKISNDVLFNAFVNFQCCDVDNIMTN